MPVILQHGNTHTTAKRKRGGVMNHDHHVSLINQEVLTLTKLSKIHIARQSQHLSKFYK